MTNIIVDIETTSQLNLVAPEMEASKVLKDAEKIKSDIQNKKEKWIEEAALYAERGRIIAIGFKVEDDEEEILHGEDEVKLLKEFFGMLISKGEYYLIGHYIKNFDLPYLMRRSFVNGIRPPKFMAGRYMGDHIIDTMEAWACGTRDMISLDNLSKALGVGSKNGNGKDFYTIYKQDEQKAFEYLKNDLRLTQACAKKMSLI